ncbi:MAG: hypothetical protein R6W82_10510 [bacterium]
MIEPDRGVKTPGHRVKITERFTGAMAMASAGLMLRITGRLLAASNEEVEESTFLVARGEKGLDEIAGWLENGSGTGVI